MFPPSSASDDEELFFDSEEAHHPAAHGHQVSRVEHEQPESQQQESANNALGGEGIINHTSPPQPTQPPVSLHHLLHHRLAGSDEEEYIKRRSSWLSQQAGPVPAIPARFLQPAASPSPPSTSTSTSFPRRDNNHFDSNTTTTTTTVARREESRARSRTRHSRDPSLSLLDDHRVYSPRSATPARAEHGMTTSAPTRPALSPAPGAFLTHRRTRRLSSVNRESRHLNTDDQTLAALTGEPTNMQTKREDGNVDLFLQLAEGGGGGETGGNRTASMVRRAGSRSSWHGKRRSMQSDALLSSPEERRPMTSGGPTGGRLGSRLEALQSEHRLHSPRTNSDTDSVMSMGDADDSVSLSGASRLGRPARFSSAIDRSLASQSRFSKRVSSPETPSFGRRRPSFGGAVQPKAHKIPRLESEGESPADSSEPKRSAPGSDSVESQTAPSTVWDELDDLKSRIKKLELTGKLPPTSGAAVAASMEQSERPRTATTAPTTIDSSPKRERKPSPSVVESKIDLGSQGDVMQEDAKKDVVGGPAAANIHPFLHSALAKAKPLLNHSLYRSLEATATDALQLAVMTGSAGPQGTAFSAASIINGVTVSDRHVRRKADTMCRNLTDLCLALCEGKHEAPSLTASPITMEFTARATPTQQRRFSRASIAPSNSADRSGGRAVSRLEARRSSILGFQAGSGKEIGSRRNSDDMSGVELEESPSHSNAQDRSQQQQQQERFDRVASRLAAPRTARYEEASGDDEDPTVRPPSRAMTDVGNFRSRYSNSTLRDFSPTTQQASPTTTFRESMAMRHANTNAHENNRATFGRLSSLTSTSDRRRFLRDSTPPVLEEENLGLGYQPSSSSQSQSQFQGGRRVTSMGQYATRRSADLAGRRTSLGHQGRNLLVE